MTMLSTWSVLWAAFALMVSAAPNYYGNYVQPQPESDAPAGFDCSGLEDGAHGLGGCSKDYWLCWEGAATSQECPDDLLFNDANGQCDFVVNIFACSGAVPTTFASDNAEMAPVNFDCSNLEDGDYAFSQSCQVTYVSCVAGAPWERSCPEELSFDYENRICDRLENIIACGGSPPTAPTVNDVPVLVISFDCPIPTGSFAVPSALCSSTYYACNDNVATIAMCDDPMIWDDSSKQCSLPKDIPECDFDCSGKADSSYSEGCSQYYWWCWDEKATKLACPDDMVFDGERVQCDFSTNVVECGGVAPSIIASDNASPMPVDFDCTNLEDGNHAFQNGEVCQPKFVSCVDGVAWELDCPDGLMFDPDQMLCERLDSIVACGGTAEPMTTASYDYQTPAAEPITRKSYSYQAPAAEPTTRKPYSYQAPAAEPTTRKPYSYQVPAAEPITRKSYSYQAPAAEPTTRKSYGYQAPVAEPTTKSSYGNYQTKAADSIARRVIKTSAYQTLAAQPTARRQIKTNYQTPVVKPAIRRISHPTRVVAPKTHASYGGYQAPAPIPAIRRQINTNGGYQTRTLAAPKISARQLNAGGYQKINDKPIVRQSNYQTKTSSADHFKVLKTLFSSYQSPAAEPTTRRQSYGYQATTPAAEPITRSYGGYKATTPAEEPTTSSYGQSLIAAEPTTRARKWYYKKVYIDEPITRSHIKQQSSY